MARSIRPAGTLGREASHRMRFVFLQPRGLGAGAMAQRFGSQPDPLTLALQQGG